jgi:peptide/nickel transport system substrate-binding protein
MKNEPVGLYIFRYILGVTLIALVAMLYWSSIIQEDALIDLKQEMRGQLAEVQNLKAVLKSHNKEVLQTIIAQQRQNQNVLKELTFQVINSPSVLHGNKKTATPRFGIKEENPGSTFKLRQESQEIATRSQMDDRYPNLLEEDTFYKKTLFKLLPEGFTPHGIRQEATVGKPDNLHPFSNWSQVSSWQSMCNVTAAKLAFGRYETLTSDMAVKMEERPSGPDGSNEYWVHLQDKVYWQPLNPEHFPDTVQLAPQFMQGNQVTSRDFKFNYDAIMNPFVQEAGAVSLRTYLGDIEDFRIIDDLTFVVRWKTHKVGVTKEDLANKVKYTAKQLTGGLKPLPRFVFQHFADGTKIAEDDSDPDTYRKNSVWAQNFSQHWARNVIVSCGAWMFDGMTDRQISFKRNPYFYDPLAVLVEGIEIEFKETPDAIWQDFKAGKLDTYLLRPDEGIELENFLKSEEYLTQEKKGNSIKRIDYLSHAYNYIGWNQKTSWFSQQKVRQAMTMAIDRKRIIDNNLNGMGELITGPFFKSSPSYDESIEPWEFNPRKAKALLAEEGWFDSDGDGVVDKTVDGKLIPFRFKLTYYVKNPTSKSNSEYITTALKTIGIDAQLNGVDIADLSAMFDDKSFDAIYLGWALGAPPEEPKQLWHSAGAKEKGSSNAVGFESPEADKIIDQLQYEYNVKLREDLYHRFHQIIYEEAPYTFLYTPKSILLYRNYVKNVFIPSAREDLVPGGNISSPDSSVFWLDEKKE